MAYVDIHDQPGPHRDTFEMDAVLAAVATDDYTIWEAPFACKIREVYILFDDAVTGAASTFMLQVYNRGTDGQSATALALPAALASGFVAGVDPLAHEAYRIYNPSTYLAAAVGTVLAMRRTQVGNGMDMPRIRGYVEYEGN